MCAQQQQQNRSEQNQPVSRSICRRRRDQKERKSPAHSLSNPFRFYFSSLSLSFCCVTKCHPSSSFFSFAADDVVQSVVPLWRTQTDRQTARPTDLHTLNYKCVSLRFHSFFLFLPSFTFHIRALFLGTLCSLSTAHCECVCVCLEGLFSGPLCF